jgi:phage terminase small subunit
MEHPYIDLTGLDRVKAAAIASFQVEEFMVPPPPGSGDVAEPRPVRKIRVKLADKRAALVDLAKLKGMMPSTRKVA